MHRDRQAGRGHTDRRHNQQQQQALHLVKTVQLVISSALLTQRSEAPCGAGVAAALTTGVATAALTHAGTGDAAPG